MVMGSGHGGGGQGSQKPRGVEKRGLQQDTLPVIKSQ